MTLAEAIKVVEDEGLPSTVIYVDRVYWTDGHPKVHYRIDREALSS
jgi:hypothetical protein